MLILKLRIVSGRKSSTGTGIGAFLTTKEREVSSKMDWENKFTSILREAESNLTKTRVLTVMFLNTVL